MASLAARGVALSPALGTLPPAQGDPEDGGAGRGVSGGSAVEAGGMRDEPLQAAQSED
jgi:hypothetical protein